MTPFNRHLQAACGYLSLGMTLEAHDELGEVEPEMSGHSDVLAIRAGIYRALEKWDNMAAVSERLCKLRDDDPQWPLALAYAIRRHTSLQEAHDVLAHASKVFCGNPRILFNLACYQAQLGHLDAARGSLREAVEHAPEFLALAFVEPDLQPLRSFIGEFSKAQAQSTEIIPD